MLEFFFQISPRKYLNHCDVSHKYHISNIRKVPLIQKLMVGSNVLNFRIDYIEKNLMTFESQMISGFFFYVFSGRIPKVDYTNIKNSRSTKIREEGNYYVSLNTSKLNQIASFFSQITLEIGSFLNKVSIDLRLNQINELTIGTNKNQFSYNLNSSASLFYDINEFIKYNMEGVSLTRINLNMNLFVSNLPDQVKKGNILKNIFFF